MHFWHPPLFRSQVEFFSISEHTVRHAKTKKVGSKICEQQKVRFSLSNTKKLMR